MSKARIIADYAGTGASTDLATQDELNTVSTVANAALPTTTAASTYAPLASPTFTGNFTSVGIDDNADANAITIDSSERVGIGSSAGAQNVQADRLVVGDGTGDEGITIYSGAGSGDTGNLFFADSGNAVQGGISYDQGDNKMLFRVNDANKMIIDSSGHLIHNGVTTYTTKFYQAGTTANNFDITVPDDSLRSNSYLVQCSYSVYMTGAYHGQLHALYSGQGTGITLIYTLQNIGAGSPYVAGYFTVTKPASTTLRVSKEAGSNGSLGVGMIRVIFPTTIS